VLVDTRVVPVAVEVEDIKYVWSEADEGREWPGKKT
jgi:hypothetical protein